MEPNITFENLFTYSPMGFQMVSHVLTLGYAVMGAALLYFVLTVKQVAPRYRASNYLSVVVMVSAFLLLFEQQRNWVAAFAWDPATAQYIRVATEANFTNGYRYLNWLIDVPMLLFQILFVLEVSQSQFRSWRNQFWFSGAMMILTGYIGQYYEVSDPYGWFLVWGAISTVFFLHVLWVMRKVITDGSNGLPDEARSLLNAIWWLFVVSWMLYPGAYLMPLLLNSEAGVVGRQITYTIADISSKVIYGVLLTQVALSRSRHEGYRFEQLTEFSPMQRVTNGN